MRNNNSILKQNNMNVNNVEPPCITRTTDYKNTQH